MGAAACALLGAGLTEQLFVPAQKCFLACRVRDGCREVTRTKACGICVCVCVLLPQMHRKQYCILFIYIRFIMKHIFSLT